MLAIKTEEGEQMGEAEKSFVSVFLWLAIRDSWLMGDKMTCDRTAELLPRQKIMSTSQGTRLTVRIFLPTPHSTCYANFRLRLSPMSCLETKTYKIQTFYLFCNINSVSPRMQMQFLHITKIWLLSILSEESESHDSYTSNGFISQKQT